MYRLIIILVLAGVSRIGLAQSHSLQARHLTVADGLSSNVVHCIFQEIQSILNKERESGTEAGDNKLSE